MNKFSIVALSAVASMAFAMENTMEQTTTGGMPIKVYTNIDLNMAKLSVDQPGTSTLDMGYGLAVGADGVYMFNDTMGAGIGLDFNMLKGEKTISGAKVTIDSNYLDIPLSFAYNWVPTDGMSAAFLVGPYFGIPLAKWNIKDPGGDAKDKANLATGLNLETHTTWEMTKEFAIGAHIGFKYAFNDLDKDLDGTQKYWALGLGLSAKFL